MHSQEVAATINVRNRLEQRRTTPIPIEDVRLAVARLHAVRRQLAIQPLFDEQFLSPGEVKNRDAYERIVARRLVAEGRFVCALPATTMIDGQLTPDFVVDDTLVEVKSIAGRLVARRVRRAADQTGFLGGGLILRVSDPAYLPVVRRAITSAIARGSLQFVRLESGDPAVAEHYGEWWHHADR